MARTYSCHQAVCRKWGTLKADRIGEGFDMIIVRELTGGLYFGERKTEEINGVVTAVDTLSYNEKEIRRIAVKAFEIAGKRKKKVTSVDKANVLDSSRLWRNVVEDVAKDYPDITLEHMLVDNCAMQLVHNPGQFDVILTENINIIMTINAGHPQEAISLGVAIFAPVVVIAETTWKRAFIGAMCAINATNVPAIIMPAIRNWNWISLNNAFPFVLTIL